MFSDIIDKLFKKKDKKTILYLAALLAAGVLFISLSFFAKKPSANASESETGKALEAATAQTTVSNDDYGETLEKKLAGILTLVDGAGDVSVMITFSQGVETVIAKDVTTDDSQTVENDSSGGTRNISANKKTETTLFVKAADGTEQPITLKELTPKIQGVLIVAQGGGNVIVKDALTRAAQTVLGVEINKVAVYKMK